MPSNFDRANWAHKAIQAFADEALSGIVEEESLMDLICDLGHFGRMKLGLSRERRGHE